MIQVLLLVNHPTEEPGAVLDGVFVSRLRKGPEVSVCTREVLAFPRSGWANSQALVTQVSVALKSSKASIQRCYSISQALGLPNHGLYFKIV